MLYILSTYRHLFMLIILCSLSIFHAEAQNSTTQSSDEITYIKIGVNGMACPFCAYGLEKKIKNIEGSGELYVDINEGYVTFTVPADNKPTKEKLQKIVKEAGFEAREIEFSLEAFNKIKDE